MASIFGGVRCEGARVCADVWSKAGESEGLKKTWARQHKSHLHEWIRPAASCES